MADALRIAAGLDLPLDTITQATACLAKRRAGKSYLARRLAEQVHHADQQLVIVDPKGDWWGIRSASDGKGPGLPILILGGEHGDLPLEASAGEVIAKLVVEQRVSVLLDLSLFRKHEVATFMAAFLESLYRLKAIERFRTPVLLIVDEADAIAPQKPQPNEARMLGAIEDLVRRGGQRGVGVVMVSQRAAVLNKNVLTQVQIMIALRTISPQDLSAMNDWIDVHGTAEQRKTLIGSLPSLPVGDAWVWSPGWPTDGGIFQRIHTLPIETFDSGATPKAGEKRIEPKRMADVDLDAVRKQMAATIERAKADDPKALRARIAELELDVARAKKEEPDDFTPEQAGFMADNNRLRADLDAALVEVDDWRGKALDFERRLSEVVDDHAMALLDIYNKLTEIADYARQASVAAGSSAEDLLKEYSRRGCGPMAQRAADERVARDAPLGRKSGDGVGHHWTDPTPAPPPVPAAARPAKNADRPSPPGGLRAGAVRMLQVLLDFAPATMTRHQIGFAAGVKHTSGTFSTYWGELKQLGFLQEAGDEYTISTAGRRHLRHTLKHDVSTLAKRVEFYRTLLRAGAVRMLDAVVAAPRGLTREQLGKQTGIAPSSGTFSTYLGELVNNRLVQKSGGALRPHPWLVKGADHG